MNYSVCGKSLDEHRREFYRKCDKKKNRLDDNNVMYHKEQRLIARRIILCMSPDCLGLHLNSLDTFDAVIDWVTGVGNQPFNLKENLNLK